MKRCRWRLLPHATRDRGAAAVEFALVVPLLLLLVFGIIDFSRAYNTRVTLTEAAAEGARALSIGRSDADAMTAARNALDRSTIAPGSVRFAVTGRCGSTANTSSTGAMRVTVTFKLLTPLVPGVPRQFDLQGVGTRSCAT